MSTLNGGIVIATVDMDPATAQFPITDLGQPREIETTGDENGSLFDTHKSGKSVVDTATFTTKNLKTALDLVGQKGMCINSDGSHVGLAAYGERLSQCDARATGASHTRWRYKAGHLRLGTLQADNLQDATLSLILAATSSDGTDPVEIFHNQSLPTGLETEVWTMGLSKFAGVLMTQQTGLSIDFGVDVYVRHDPGSIYPSFAASKKVKATVRIRTSDPTLVHSTKILAGKEATHANTLLQLIKKKHGDFHEDYASTVHIAATVAGLVKVNEKFAASGENEGQVEFMVETVFTPTGSILPFVLNTNATYNAALV